MLGIGTYLILSLQKLTSYPLIIYFLKNITNQYYLCYNEE